MSDTDTKVLLQRLAALEAEVSGYRKQPAGGFDKAALVNDPVGFMRKHGVPADHITKVLVAEQLGDAAPPEMRYLGQMGPMVNATSTLQSQFETLSRQFQEFVDSQKGNSTRASFKAIATDKKKYPHLSKALNKRADRYDEEASKFEGTAEEYAKQKEAYLQEMAELFGAPPASEVDADETADVEMMSDEQEATESENGGPAVAGGLNSEMPSLKKVSGPLDEKGKADLKASILRKYNLR